jgi:hypothetical protein
MIGLFGAADRAGILGKERLDRWFLDLQLQAHRQRYRRFGEYEFESESPVL